MYHIVIRARVAAMKHAIVIIALLVAGCGKSGEQRAREEAEAEAKKHPEEAPAPPPPKQVAPADKPKAPSEPEPTTPAEIDHARNQAMIDGRDKDVIKYCELAKLDDKSNPQALLGCALAACRLNDADKAKVYAKPLPKLLMDQARKVCLTYHIGV